MGTKAHRPRRLKGIADEEQVKTVPRVQDKERPSPLWEGPNCLLFGLGRFEEARPATHEDQKTFHVLCSGSFWERMMLPALTVPLVASYGRPTGAGVVKPGPMLVHCLSGPIENIRQKP